jgi:hypothetical protein
VAHPTGETKGEIVVNIAVVVTVLDPPGRHSPAGEDELIEPVVFINGCVILIGGLGEELFVQAGEIPSSRAAASVLSRPA